MGKLFPLQGTVWPAPFPTLSPVPRQQGMSWEGKMEAGENYLVSPQKGNPSCDAVGSRRPSRLGEGEEAG